MPQLLNLEEFKKWVQNLVRQLEDKSIILLEGELGAGKTQFCKFLAEEFGYRDVTSPSFSLINAYEGQAHSIFHIDLYRLENHDELESIGFWDLFLNTKAIVCIEWANKMNYQDLPFDWTKYLVKLEKVKEDPSLRSIYFSICDL